MSLWVVVEVVVVGVFSEYTINGLFVFPNWKGAMSSVTFLTPSTLPPHHSQRSPNTRFKRKSNSSLVSGVGRMSE